MRVLHVIPSVAPVRGGPSEAILAMVNALRSAEINAEIATTNDNGVDLLDVPTGKCVNYPLGTIEGDKSVPIWFFPRFSPNYHPVKEFAFSREMTQWLWQNIRKYDLLHVHAIFSYASTATMVIARLQGVPYIVRPLGQLCQWSLQQSAQKKQIYLKLIEKANLNRSRGLHLTSVQEQQEIHPLGISAPSFILPHGLNLPSLIPDARNKLRRFFNLPLDEPIILFLSRLHPKKGLEYLIPSLGNLAHERFTLIIGGDGSQEYKSEIESLLVSSGIRQRTYLPGFVTGEMKNLLLQGSDLFALTSHSENFGVAVIEAMASGLPVLVTPGVALASVVSEHEAGYVSELNVKAITSCIEGYFRYPQMAKEMGNRGQKLVSQSYTWDSVANHLNHIYQEIISQKSKLLI